MKKHLLTCAVVISLIAGTFFIVFTFESLVFALARVQFLSSSASYRGDFVGRESQQQIDLDRAAIEEEPQKTDPAAFAARSAAHYEEGYRAMAATAGSIWNLR